MPTRKRAMPPAPKRTMPARKCRRTPVPVPELPVGLLLEIAARTDAATIFRCAATCKPLRREILSADFVRRVCQGPGAVVPSKTLCILGEETFSVVHPHTAAFLTLERHYLSPFMSRSGSIAATGLLEEYKPQTSRNGLIVLKRRGAINWRRKRELFVYDPMTKSRTFLPLAPEIGRDPYHGLLGGVAVIDYCALLTAADGIGCSFMLIAADMARADFGGTSVRIRVQTVSSSDSEAGGSARLEWSPVKTTAGHPCPFWCMFSLCSDDKDDPVVVSGVVHWLLHNRNFISLKEEEDNVGEHILTYDVNAAAVGSVHIPKDRHPLTSSSQLVSSPDGTKLSFVATHQCTVSVWVLSSGGSWERHVEIDMIAEWGSMIPTQKPSMDHWLKLVEGFGDQRSGAVFLWFSGVFVVLDMETGGTSVTSSQGAKKDIPYEVDLASRLTSMKPF